MKTQAIPVLFDQPPLKILIVDDEPMLRSVIQDFLSMLGFEDQQVAGDGMEALEIIRSMPIDCMLSDIRMPKMELEELLGIIQMEFPKLIVVATSGYSDLESARNIFQKGAHDFLGKPLNLDTLELALHWIQERRHVLQCASSLFGQTTLSLSPDQAEPRFEELAETLRQTVNHFQSQMRHSIRVARLLHQLDLGLGHEARLNLETAGLLHELGTGYQIQSLCSQPRRLDEDELNLVREHARITGRLLSHALERPEFDIIIGQHLCWQTLPVNHLETEAPLEYLAAWLGTINAIDGCMHDRPDRPAITSNQIKEMLTRRMKKNLMFPLERLLDQWLAIEAYYASCA